MKTMITVFALCMLLGAPAYAGAPSASELAEAVCYGPGLLTPEQEHDALLAFLVNVGSINNKSCQKTCKGFASACEKTVKAQNSCMSAVIGGGLKTGAELCVGLGQSKEVCKATVKAMEQEEMAKAKIIAWGESFECELYKNVCYSMCY